MARKLFGIFLYWRLFLFVPLFAASLVLPARRHYEYTLLQYYIGSDSPINHFFLIPFGNFDSVYYLMIAGAGYTINAGFFPLFPLLLRAISMPFGKVDPFYPIQFVLAFLLVNVLAFGAIWLLYKLIRLDYAKEIATESVLAFLFFPAAFFLVCFYSEGLFVFLTALSFYFARRKNWAGAGIAGILLTATRIVGIAIVPALLWEWYSWWRNETKRTLRTLLVSLIPVLLTPLGLIAYMAYNYVKWSDVIFFIHAQGTFLNNRSVSSVVLFPQTMFRYLKILTSVSSMQYEWWIALLELVSVLFVLLFLLLAWQKKVRTSYLLFAVLAFLIPASTGTFTGMPRYVMVLFPLFIATALLKNKTIRYSIYTVFFLLQILLIFLFAKGYFVA
ncbi:MAG: mannosyltransferase family protein [bacterium]|nr:mannosyltransferase family protein [bacterium]